MVSAVHEQHAIAFRGKPKLRWRRCQQRAKIQTALVHLRLWKHIFCEVHPVGTVVGQAPHNSKPVLKFYQVPPAICFRCVVTPSWYLTNLSDDPEWTLSGLIVTRQSGHIRQATGHLPRGLVFGLRRLRLWERGALEFRCR